MTGIAQSLFTDRFSQVALCWLPFDLNQTIDQLHRLPEHNQSDDSSQHGPNLNSITELLETIKTNPERKKTKFCNIQKATESLEVPEKVRATRRLFLRIFRVFFAFEKFFFSLVIWLLTTCELQAMCLLCDHSKSFLGLKNRVLPFENRTVIKQRSN